MRKTRIQLVSSPLWFLIQFHFLYFGFEWFLGRKKVEIPFSKNRGKLKTSKMLINHTTPLYTIWVICHEMSNGNGS